MTEPARVPMPDWIRALAASHPFGAGDRRGTANLVDAAARARAAGCIRTGESVSLARPLLGGDYNTTAERPGFRHETWYRAAPDGTGWGQDHLVLNPHGLQNTHLDALSHVAVDGTFYGGRPVTDAEQGSADVLAPDGLVTRAGARWVAEHQVSILAWDMLDSREAKAAHASAHILTWAIGLLLLDNCDFAALRRAHGPGTKVAGALVVALLAVEGANGVNLNPL